MKQLKQMEIGTCIVDLRPKFCLAIVVFLFPFSKDEHWIYVYAECTKTQYQSSTLVVIQKE